MPVPVRRQGSWRAIQETPYSPIRGLRPCSPRPRDEHAPRGHHHPNVAKAVRPPAGAETVKAIVGGRDRARDQLLGPVGLGCLGSYSASPPSPGSSIAVSKPQSASVTGRVNSTPWVFSSSKVARMSSHIRNTSWC